MSALPLTTLAARLCLILALLLPLSACVDPEAAALTETDEIYDVVLDRRDGQAAVKFVSAETLKFYDTVVKNARTMSKSKLKELAYSEKYEILRARLAFKKDELKKMDGKALYIGIVERGYSGSTSDCRRVRVKVTGDRGVITYKHKDARGPGQTFDGYFIKEDGEWKADYVSQRAVDDKEARDAARAEGMSLDEYVIAMLREELGEVPDSVWNPPR